MSLYIKAVGAIFALDESETHRIDGQMRAVRRGEIEQVDIAGEERWRAKVAAALSNVAIEKPLMVAALPVALLAILYNLGRVLVRLVA